MLSGVYGPSVTPWGFYNLCKNSKKMNLTVFLVSNPNFTFFKSFVSVLDSIYCRVNTASPHFITSYL